MAKRLFLRAGEVGVLFGIDSKTSLWKLWSNLTNPSQYEVGEYDKWRGRLVMPIMQGIVEDHDLRLDKHAATEAVVHKGMIMPPRGWVVEPCLRTEGHKAILFVEQRTSLSMRDWKLPDVLPPHQIMRMKAIATAHDVSCVLMGVLVDGYTSQLFSLTVSEAERQEIRDKVAAFIAIVETGDEPDVDFSKDEREIRAGIAITQVKHSASQIETIIHERKNLAVKLPAAQTAERAIVSRMHEIDTILIHMAGKDGRLETDKNLVVITRNSKDVPTVTVSEKGASLF